MKAIRVHNYGGLDVLVLEDIKQPEPQQSEVLLRVCAAGVNQLDWKIRAGNMKDFMPMPLPFTPGMDVAGIVEAVGDGVTTWQVGQEVYGELGMGTYAEFALASEEILALKPKTLDFVQAASVPMVAMTAWQALFDCADLQSGQTILIHAASGGVGMFAVQFAKWKGAHVIGTTSAANSDFVRSLGADEVIDYKETPFETVVQDVDVVLDPFGGDTRERSYGVLKPGGILVALAVAIAPPLEEAKAKAHDVRALMLNAKPSASLLAKITQLIDDGQIKTVVIDCHPMLTLSHRKRMVNF